MVRYFPSAQIRDNLQAEVRLPRWFRLYHIRFRRMPRQSPALSGHFLPYRIKYVHNDAGSLRREVPVLLQQLSSCILDADHTLQLPVLPPEASQICGSSLATLLQYGDLPDPLHMGTDRNVHPLRYRMYS